MRTSLKISASAIVAAMLLTAPASALTLNLGGNGSGGVVNFGGSNTDPNVDVLTNGTVGNGSPSGMATTNALSGDGGPTTAAVSLKGAGGGGDANANVLLDLFGAGGGNNAAVGLGSGNGTNGSAVLDLFGNPGSGGGGPGAGGTGSSNELFGPSSGATNTNGPGAGGVRLVALGNATNRCFAPDPTQIARLTSRHDYNEMTFSGWVRASSVSIVSTNLCDAARKAIAHDGNVARLQAFVNSNPALRSLLARQGKSANEVIAVDKKGDTLTLYVS